MPLYVQELLKIGVPSLITLLLSLIPYYKTWLGEDKIITSLIKKNDHNFKNVSNKLILPSRELVRWIIFLIIGVRLFSYVVIYIAKLNNIVVYFWNLTYFVAGVVIVFTFLVQTTKRKSLLLRLNVSTFILLFFTLENIGLVARIEEINKIIKNGTFKGNILVGGEQYYFNMCVIFTLLSVCVFIMYMYWFYMLIKYIQLHRRSKANICVNLHTASYIITNIALKEMHVGAKGIAVLLEKDNVGYIIPISDIKLKEYKYIKT